MEDRVALRSSGGGVVEEVLLLTPGEKIPEVQRQKSAHFREFALFLREVRRYFEEADFLETPTATLVTCPGMEAHLDPFEVPLENGKSLFLPTSPEIQLKKRLCEGFEKIFELRPCFRNDPESPWHRKEFHMLEWYRAYAPLSALKKDIEGLLEHLKAKGLWEKPTRIRSHTFKELFKTHLDFDLKPDTSREELLELFARLALHFHPSDTKVDLIHRLLIEKLEPHFEGLMVLESFPPEMAVLSRLDKEGFAARFELYLDGVELANAFDEVNDPTLQRARWEEDVNERKRLGLKALSYDQELIDRMTHWGLPPSAGIALGIDRLFLLAKKVRRTFW